MTDQSGVAERNGITEQLADLNNLKRQFGSLVDSYVEAFSGGLKTINGIFVDHLNGMNAFRRTISDMPMSSSGGGGGGGSATGDSGGSSDAPKIHYEIAGDDLKKLDEISTGLTSDAEALYTALNKVLAGTKASSQEIAQVFSIIDEHSNKTIETLHTKTTELQKTVADRYLELCTSAAKAQETAQERLTQLKAEQELRILAEVSKRKEAERQKLYEQAILDGKDLTDKKTQLELEAQFEVLEERYASESLIASIRTEVLENEKQLILDRQEAEEAAIQAAKEAEKAKAKAKEANAKKARQEEYKEKYKNLQKLSEFNSKQQDKKKRMAQAQEDIFGKGHTMSERWEAMQRFITQDDEGGERTTANKVGAAVGLLTNALSNVVKSLENKMDAIGKYQAPIDTRLQGSTLNKQYAGSYWGQLQKDLMAIGGFSPYFTQEDFSNNIKTLVDKGIAFDLKQRAFLMTIQDKIATTFEVADGTLLRLIRIQQADSTAGRMGMEVALNSFLNNMYENTEYLKDVASSVRGSLQEMSALMTSTGATEVEYQVQKWLGSLYSVGMSQEGVNAIAQAFGSLAAGDVDALSNGAGNLLVMAAQNSGIPLADMMAKGITASDTNQLLGALTNYLIQTAEDTKENHVVMQQMAKVFGLKASDLKAAENLKTVKALEQTSKHNLGYDNMLSSLFSMANTMHKRTSIGEMLSNAWNNAQFSLASSVAKNPITYGLAKGATLLEDLTGGIDLPFLNVMGFGVDLNTSVAQLMRVGALTGGIIGSIGDMVSGLGNMFGPGGKMLEAAGIKKSGASTLTIESRGSGLGNTGPGTDYSESGSLTSNGSSQDMVDSTMAGAEKDKKDQLVEAKDEMEDNEVTALNTYVLSIYKILDQVINGTSQFHVKVTSSTLGTDSLYGTGGGWGVVLGG